MYYKNIVSEVRVKVEKEKVVIYESRIQPNNRPPEVKNQLKYWYQIWKIANKKVTLKTKSETAETEPFSATAVIATMVLY